SDGADLEQFGGASAPLRIALDDAEGAVFEVVIDLPSPLNVFARGDGDGGAFAQLGEAIDLFGLGGLLDPAGTVGFDALGPLEGIGQVPAAVDVEHEFGIVADGLAEEAHEVDVLAQAFGSVAGAVGEEPLLIAIAFELQLGGAGLGLIGFEGVSETPGVGFDGLAGGSAEETIDRRFEKAPTEVPEGVVDGGDGHEEEAAAGVAVGAVELVPELLLREGVLLEEEGAQLLVDDDGDFFVDGAVEAIGTSIGPDLQVIGGHRGVLDRGLRRVGIGLGAKLIVDVEGVDLVLLIDAAGGVAMALELEDFDSGDVEGFGLSERGQGGEGCEKAAARVGHGLILAGALWACGLGLDAETRRHGGRRGEEAKGEEKDRNSRVRRVAGKAEKAEGSVSELRSDGQT